MNTTLDQNGPDAGLAWGFLGATATTPRWHGLGVGATGLGVVDLWSDEPDDFEQVFTVPTDLRELYLDFDSGTNELSATLGRRAFPANPVLDGDSQQGLGLSLPLNNGATVHVAAQIADLPIGPPRQGIAVHRLAARGMAVVGSTLDLSLARGKRRWDSELILAYHHNLVPRQIKPDYGDVWSARLHTGLVGERFSAGGGVYVDFSKASKISYMHLGTTLGFSF